MSLKVGDTVNSDIYTLVLISKLWVKRNTQGLQVNLWDSRWLGPLPNLKAGAQVWEVGGPFTSSCLSEGADPETSVWYLVWGLSLKVNRSLLWSCWSPYHEYFLTAASVNFTKTRLASAFKCRLLGYQWTSPWTYKLMTEWHCCYYLLVQYSQLLAIHEVCDLWLRRGGKKEKGYSKMSTSAYFQFTMVALCHHHPGQKIFIQLVFSPLIRTWEGWTVNSPRCKTLQPWGCSLEQHKS